MRANPIVRRVGGALVLSAMALCAYWLTLAPDVLTGDSGEFQFAAPLLSLVHPTGYPLYLLLAKLFTLLPVGSIAYRVNLLSAVCAAVTVGLLYLTARQMAVDEMEGHPLLARLAAGASAATFAVSLTFWTHATEATTYTLNALFVVALLLLSLQVRRSPRLWPLLALVLGLSLAHHRTTVLLLPALAIYLWPWTGLRRHWRAAAAAAALPLLLYLYIPLRVDATPYAQLRLDAQHIIVSIADTPSALLGYALGRTYEGELRWDDVSLQRLLGTPQRVAGELGLGAGLLMLLAVARLIGRRGRPDSARRLALLAAAALCYTLFNALYHIGNISDYYPPLYIICSLLLGQGAALLGVLLRAAVRRLPGMAQRSSAAAWIASAPVMVLAIVLPLSLLMQNAPRLQERAAAPVRAEWEQRLAEPLPLGAILMSNDRDEMTPMYYLQLVEGVRPDLFGLYPLISSDPRLSNVATLTAYALETVHPVYYIKPMSDLQVKFRLQQEGPLQRVLGWQSLEPAHPLSGQAGPSLSLVGWSDSVQDSKLEIALFWRVVAAPVSDLKTYVHILDRSGALVVQSDHVPGGDLYPPAQWSSGETLRDAHQLSLPAGQPAAAYAFVAGAYTPDGKGIPGIASVQLRAAP